MLGSSWSNADNYQKDLGKDWLEMTRTYFKETGYDARFESNKPNKDARWIDYHSFGNIGMMLGTLHGDGSYPVYVEMNKSGSKVRRIIIDFDSSIESDATDEDGGDDYAESNN